MPLSTKILNYGEPTLQNTKVTFYVVNLATS